MNAQHAKVLVVVYSRTGTTRKVANAIASRCGADVEEIQDVRSRRGFFGFLRSGREALRRALPEIRPTIRNPADYDVVVVGAPVWAGHLASPVRTYLARLAQPLKATAFFATMGGSGGDVAVAEMAQLSRTTPLGTLVLTERAVAQRQHERSVDEFAKVIAQRIGSEERSGAHLRLVDAH